MKTLLKTVICTFALSALFAFNASADDKEAKKITGFSTGIYTCVSGKVNVNIDKYNKKATVIEIENGNGTVLYREVTGRYQTKMRRSLDVSGLPSGEYTLKITSGDEQQTKKLELFEKLPERLISLK
jgi:hypothetical protein